jgi:2-phosphoglycerate kinase
MASYLITGRSGIGKTTVGIELKRRNYNVVDGDNIPGLARWEDIKTGKTIIVKTDDFVDYSKVAWNWNGKVLKNLLAHNKKLFLTGSATNQLEFHNLFDLVFVLTINASSHERRILERENYGNYGKHPKMIKQILNEQQKLVKESLKLGAIPIDADQSVEKSVDCILRHIKHDH